MAGIKTIRFNNIEFAHIFAIGIEWKEMMTDQANRRASYSTLQIAMIAGGAATVVAALIWPGAVLETIGFVLRSLVVISPIVLPGIFLAAWIVASGADRRIAGVFQRRMGWSIVAASAIGAVTPVCGMTVLPLMVGLLAGGVPLAPVLAFWLSSPVTDPAMLATTAATLGLAFAIGKTVAAFGLGLMGGAAGWLFATANWSQQPLRQNAIVGQITTRRCGCDQPFRAAFWKEAERRKQFLGQFRATSRLILICLVPALASASIVWSVAGSSHLARPNRL